MAYKNVAPVQIDQLRVTMDKFDIIATTDKLNGKSVTRFSWPSIISELQNGAYLGWPPILEVTNELRTCIGILYAN